MSRVATIPLQRTMSAAIQRSQQLLSATQAQLSTGKKAPDYASLGTEAVRNLSAHSLVTQQDAYATAAIQVGTALSMNDVHMGAIDTGASALRQKLLVGLGGGLGWGSTMRLRRRFSSSGRR